MQAPFKNLFRFASFVTLGSFSERRSLELYNLQASQNLALLTPSVPGYLSKHLETSGVKNHGTDLESALSLLVDSPSSPLYFPLCLLFHLFFFFFSEGWDGEAFPN